jgi:urease accessory protein UreF
MFNAPATIAIKDPTEWLGDWHPLAEQLGSADGLVELGSLSRLLQLRPVVDAPTLEAFLHDYQRRILFPLELVLIRDAFNHANAHELRELVALERRLLEEPALEFFASPSRRVGQAQLRKLRPLRDHRFVQRYLAAMESGEAQGWHMLVYGVTLSVYSLPLRQGLLGYAHQIQRGFIYAAARRLRFSELDCRRLFDRVTAPLPETVARLIGEELTTVPDGIVSV